MTWNEFAGEVKKASAAIIDAAQRRCGVTLADPAQSKTNGAFRGSGLTADLSAFAGQKVDFTFGAIPVADETTIIPLYQFTDVVVLE